MQFKTLEEVQTALATRLPEGQLKVRREENKQTGRVQEFSYVPWEVTTRQLDAIFGPFGWTEEVTNQQYDTQKGIYIVTRRITGFAAVTEGEGEDSYTHPVSITREGVGVGIAAGDNGRAHDTAIKGADSDSFSRAAKKLGDGFGLYLYDRDDPANARPANTENASASASTRQDTSAPTKANGPTEKQRKFLNDLGWNNAAIATMDFKRWKGILEAREHAPEAEPALPF